MEGRFRHQDIRQRTAKKSLLNTIISDREQAKRILLQCNHFVCSVGGTKSPKLVRPDLEAILVWAVMLHESGD